MNAPEKPNVFRASESVHIDDPMRILQHGHQERWLKILGLSVVLALFAGLGTWAALAPLTSAVIGAGVIVVENYRKAVGHLDGGIVREVRVRDGQEVRKGERLIACRISIIH